VGKGHSTVQVRFDVPYILLLLALIYIPVEAASSELKFNADGEFKILTISDLHYRAEPDTRGIELTRRLIAVEKPDLVLVAGDCITGNKNFTAAEVEKAVANVASAMEHMQPPWAIMFGNHDAEHSPKTHLGKEQMMRLYESYPHNVNAGWERGIHGVGNKNVLIWNAAATRPVFSLWLIDSGDGVVTTEERWDWIHPDQVLWYYQTSRQLENKYGAKIPGLMFFHIPLPEFTRMVNSKKVIGERREPEGSSNMNGGLFSAVLERGDVKGIFCGHDHVNNYVGLYRGVALGYDGVIGYAAYPRIPDDDPSLNRSRGGRVILIKESDPWHFKTWMRFGDGTANWESQSNRTLEEQLK
jgi:3',5'-cyclic AMP phosphodiesterase CpdA